MEQLAAKVTALTAEVHSGAPSAPTTPVDNDVEKDVRWTKVRVMFLEEELKASRAQADSLAEHLAMCLEAMRGQDDRLTERDNQLQATVDELLRRASASERELIDLRSTQNASGERLDSVAIELLELSHQTGMMAASARDSATTSAEETDYLALQLRKENDAAHKAAKRAKKQAAQTAEDTETLAQELRSENEAARRAAKRAKQRAAQTAEETEALARELREASEEARVMAEKARDRAEFSADSVAELQVDFEEEAVALRESIDRTVARLQSLEARDDATSDTVDDYAAAIRRDLHRELQSLRARLHKIDLNGEAEAEPEPMKRWRHHLAEQPKPRPPRELPAAKSDHSR